MKGREKGASFQTVVELEGKVAEQPLLNIPCSYMLGTAEGSQA